MQYLCQMGRNYLLHRVFMLLKFSFCAHSFTYLYICTFFAQPFNILSLKFAKGVHFLTKLADISFVKSSLSFSISNYKPLLKHFDMFRSCQIIIRELSSLLKLYYSIYNSIGICRRGVVAAYHVV